MVCLKSCKEKTNTGGSLMVNEYPISSCGQFFVIYETKDEWKDKGEVGRRSKSRECLEKMETGERYGFRRTP